MPVDHKDLKRTQKYLNGGFHTIAICAHGVGRSFKYAEDLSNSNTPSVFLEGGMESIESIRSPKKDQK